MPKVYINLNNERLVAKFKKLLPTTNKYGYRIIDDDDIDDLENQETEIHVVDTSEKAKALNKSYQHVISCVPNDNFDVHEYALILFKKLISTKPKVTNEQSPLLENGEDQASAKYLSDAQSSYVIKSLLGYNNDAMNWKDRVNYIWVLPNILLSLGGTFPFVIFNAHYIEVHWPKQKWLMNWATVASAVSNLGITFNSVQQLPDFVTRHFPNVIKKLLLNCKLRNIGMVFRITASTLGLVFVNLFSFFSNKELAIKSTCDLEANPPRIMMGILANSRGVKILLFAQLVGQIALVIRATANKYVDFSLNDNHLIAVKMRGKLLTVLNENLTIGKRINDDNLARLSQGKNYEPLHGGRKRVYNATRGVSKIALLGVLAYSIAFGLLSTEALGGFSFQNVTASSSNRNFNCSLLQNQTVSKHSDAFLAVVFSSNTLSKFMLLASATSEISKIVKKCLAKKIIRSRTALARTLNKILHLLLLVGIGWNTWFSAADITESNLWNIMSFSMAVGLLATAAINYLDPINLVRKLLSKIKHCCSRSKGKPPINNSDEFIKEIMFNIATMPDRDFCDYFAKRLVRNLKQDLKQEKYEQLYQFAKKLYRKFHVIPTREWDRTMGNIHSLKSSGLDSGNRRQNIQDDDDVEREKLGNSQEVLGGSNSVSLFQDALKKKLIQTFPKKVFYKPRSTKRCCGFGSCTVL